LLQAAAAAALDRKVPLSGPLVLVLAG